MGKARRAAAKGVAPLDDHLEDILARMVGLIAEVRRRQSAVTKQYGVTMLQHAAIHAVREQGPLNITGLAEQLRLNQSTVSSLVDRMERDGLMRRVQSSSDRRAVSLRLTEKAEQIAEGVEISPFDFFKNLLRPLSSAELSQLAKLLKKVEANMFESFEALDKQARSRSKRATG